MTEKIHELLATAAGRVEGIAKSETNREQGFKFRSLDKITEVAKPIFAELGISVTPLLRTVAHEEVTSRGGARGWRCVVVVDYEFGAPDGSIRKAAMAGEAIDYGDKSTTKAQQMAFKYLLTEVLLVGSGGEDADAESHEIARRDESPPKEPTPWTILWDKMAVFKTWGNDDKLAAAEVARAALAIPDTNKMTPEEADRMFSHIQGQYESREEQGALEI